MNLDQLAILIVTFKSDEILSDLLIKLQKFNVVIIENSNNENFKQVITRKYPNVKCILTNSNIGFGRALNIAFQRFKYQNYLILNPDIKITEDQVIQVYSKAISNDDISVIAPSTVSIKNKLTIRHGNFKLSKQQNSKYKELIKVDYVSGHAFLIKQHVLNKVGYFDDKFFLNFEEHDLFFRIKKKGLNVYVMKDCSIVHFEGRSSDKKYFRETSLLSKWHYGWGYFFFFNKHYNKFFSIFFSLNFFLITLIKFLTYYFKKDHFKKDLMFYTLMGMLAAFKNQKSYYRFDNLI